MTVLVSHPEVSGLETGLRSRRIWYHDIELPGGERTRFPEDYDDNPVLRAVDRSNVELGVWADEYLPKSLSGMHVLDLGCADGLHSFRAAWRGATHVIAVERNRYHVERAQWLAGELGLNNVEFRWGNVERHCPDGPFDLVICVGLLYHLVNPLGVLAMLRSRCNGTLLLSSAIDLPGEGSEKGPGEGPEGDGAPMQRLDRYATGAHGVWSFNVSMVRQMLVTAGFEILHEKFTVRGKNGEGAYLVLAKPGSFDHHHIFSETIEQEFPINLVRRRDLARRAWRRIAKDFEGPVALFGAGTHTPWLLEQVADIAGVEVACVLDERLPLTGRVAGLPVYRPDAVDLGQYSAIILSSWHQVEALRRRSLALFGDEVPTIVLDGSDEVSGHG